MNCAVPVTSPQLNGTGWLVNVNVVGVVPPGSFTLAPTVSGADGVVVIEPPQARLAVDVIVVTTLDERKYPDPKDALRRFEPFLKKYYGEEGKGWEYQGRSIGIHLDKVENLGHFMELEVVLREGETTEAGVLEADELMKRLGIEASRLIDRAYVDRATSGFDRLVPHLAAYAPAAVAPVVGLSVDTIVRFARRYGASRKSFIRPGIGPQKALDSPCLRAARSTDQHLGRFGWR